jgi:hypothetical protein
MAVEQNELLKLLFLLRCLGASGFGEQGLKLGKQKANPPFSL